MNPLMNNTMNNTTSIQSSSTINNNDNNVRMEKYGTSLIFYPLHESDDSWSRRPTSAGGKLAEIIRIASGSIPL